MTIQFIVEANQRNLQTEQVLPSVFTEPVHRVSMAILDSQQSKYVRVSTFHFTRQAVDEYYVATYHNGGFKCNSGIVLRVENVPRMPLNQQRPFVKSHADKDKRMEHECDWTIPFWFIENNNMKSYHNALLRYEQTLFYVDVDMEPHAEWADNNNHMNIKTKWRDIVHECDFKTNKMVRFKLIYDDDVVDILEMKDQLNPVKIPFFDIC
ncbi:hypothetical protein Tco_1233297 [Tanacetum coccineum]